MKNILGCANVQLNMSSHWFLNSWKKENDLAQRFIDREGTQDMSWATVGFVIWSAFQTFWARQWVRQAQLSSVVFSTAPRS